jgi:hypothetical protein
MSVRPDLDEDLVGFNCRSEVFVRRAISGTWPRKRFVTSTPRATGRAGRNQAQRGRCLLGGRGRQDQYRGGGVASTDAEVVPAAAVAQGELAELVDDVVADAEVLGGLGWRGFGPGQVGRLWCGAGVMGAWGRWVL